MPPLRDPNRAADPPPAPDQFRNPAFTGNPPESLRDQVARGKIKMVKRGQQKALAGGGTAVLAWLLATYGGGVPSDHVVIVAIGNLLAAFLDPGLAAQLAHLVALIFVAVAGHQGVFWVRNAVKTTALKCPPWVAVLALLLLTGCGGGAGLAAAGASLATAAGMFGVDQLGKGAEAADARFWAVVGRRMTVMQKAFQLQDDTCDDLRNAADEAYREIADKSLALQRRSELRREAAECYREIYPSLQDAKPGGPLPGFQVPAVVPQGNETPAVFPSIEGKVPTIAGSSARKRPDPRVASVPPRHSWHAGDF